MDREAELIDYIKKKNEALEFWTHLRSVVRSEQKLELLKREIAQATAELQELRNQRRVLS